MSQCISGKFPLCIPSESIRKSKVFYAFGGYRNINLEWIKAKLLNTLSTPNLPNVSTRPSINSNKITDKFYCPETTYSKHYFHYPILFYFLFCLRGKPSINNKIFNVNSMTKGHWERDLYICKNKSQRETMLYTLILIILKQLSSEIWLIHYKTVLLICNPSKQQKN